MSKHYYLVEWTAWITGWGHDEELAGKYSVLADNAQDALDRAKEQLAKDHPDAASTTLGVVPTIGY